MTEPSKMPARIWVNPLAIHSPDIYFPNAVMETGNPAIVRGDVQFVRADIADQMAAALREIVRDDDELDECELCGGSGEVTATTVNDDRELIGCPSCLARERSRSARAALQSYEAINAGHEAEARE